MSTVNLAQGLVDPATDPTLARLVAIEAQLNRIQASMDALARAQAEADQTRRELLGDALPIVKGVMDQVSARMGQWEQSGVLDLGRAGLRVVERVARAYRVEDVDELGDSVVAILDTVRALTQPEILALAREAGEVLEEAEGAAPTGVVGLVQATRDVNVQKGLGLLVAGLRHVGRASRVLGKKAREVHRDGPLPPPGPAQPVHCPAVAPSQPPGPRCTGPRPPRPLRPTIPAPSRLWGICASTPRAFWPIPRAGPRISARPSPTTCTCPSCRPRPGGWSTPPAQNGARAARPPISAA